MGARLCFMAILMLLGSPSTVNGDGSANSLGQWALHYGGPHSVKENTCSFSIDYTFDINPEAPVGPGSFDIYIVAAGIEAIAGTRFGIYGEGRIYFEPGGWRKCGDFEIPTEGWPGCGEGNAMTWSTEQPGPFVTMGILEVYVYGYARLWSGPDPRVGLAEWCDASQPSPVCVQMAEFDVCAPFGVLGFGLVGCNPAQVGGCYGCPTPSFDLPLYGSCDATPVNGTTWGTIKALYK